MRWWNAAGSLGRRRRRWFLTALAVLSVTCILLQLVMVQKISIPSRFLPRALPQRIFLPTPATGTTETHPTKPTALPADRLDDDADNDDDDDMPEVPIFLAENPKYRPSENSKLRHYLSVRYEGGLGNSMFAYASMWGISRRNYMKPTWPAFQLLRNYFYINTTDKTEYLSPRSWSLFLEDGANMYDKRTEKLNYDLDVVLIGFYQSWRYFTEQRHIIKQHFTFREEILWLARGYLDQAYKEKYSLLDTPAAAITYVGIHIRRGDMLHEHNTKKGYTVATVEYLETAMIFFASRHENLLFIVCSDDIAWSTKYVPETIAPVAFSSDHYDVEDMAILSLCNHTIITVGTFGWWAGWLAGGTVLYFADFPARDSDLETEFNPRDYYPPTWKGISFRIKNS